MIVWLNGAFTTLDEARISAFDAGFQHAVGLFETLQARNGSLFRGAAHLSRLAESARALQLTQDLKVEPLLEAVLQTLEKNDMPAARVRITLTGGDLNLLAQGRPHTVAGNGDDQSKQRAPRSNPTILIVAQPTTPYPDEFFTEGVMATIAGDRLNPFDSHAGHKTLHYWPRLRALQSAAGAGAGEAIWFAATNHVGSGSVSNIFLVRDGSLLTPIARGEEQTVVRDDPSFAGSSEPAHVLPSPVLPGITRQAVFEIARERSIAIEPRMLSIDDLLNADEVFLTNSSWHVLPVVRIERETVGNGAVGEVAQSIRTALLDMIQRETTA